MQDETLFDLQQRTATWIDLKLDYSQDYDKNP